MIYLKNNEEKEAIGWMEKAGEVAGRALCLRAKCGTVIVKAGEVIGSGYNAPPLDDEANRTCLDEYQFSKKPKSDRTCCIHAEWRAIMDALKNNPDKIEGSKLYFTRVDESGKLLRSGQPYCTVCSRLALDSGISFFVLWHEEGIREYPAGEYNTLSYEFLSTK